LNILVTGSTGFLGKEIVLSFEGYSIYKLNRFTGDFPCDLSCSVPRFEIIFDLVIHTAGLAHFIPNSSIESEYFSRINVKGLMNLLNGLEIKIPKKFVFISSVAVYGIEEGIGIYETESLAAKDPYGLSKIQAEELLLDWCTKHNVLCTILRLPLVVGLNPPGNLGSMINGINKGFYFNINGGFSKKSMVLASDVAKFILKASDVGGVYNLTDGYHPSFYEISSFISLQMGKKVPKNMPYWFAKIVAIVGDIIGRKAPINSTKLNKIISNLTFDDSKARKAFGWDPSPVLKEFKIVDKNL